MVLRNLHCFLKVFCSNFNDVFSMSSFPEKLNTFFFQQFKDTKIMIVYYACIFLFDFTSCHAICLLVLVNSNAHIGPGVINLEILPNAFVTIIGKGSDWHYRYICDS